MRALIIDDNFKNQIKKLVDFAEANPLSMDDLLDTFNGNRPPVGDQEGFCFCTITGYRIVYSIEEQVPGKIRHLSVSVDKDEAYPNPEAVREIMKLLGFKNVLEECIVNLEEISDKRGAINVLELIK